MGYLICKKCGGYYKLQSGESPDDFTDKCQCGGQLKHEAHLHNPTSQNTHLLSNFHIPWRLLLPLAFFLIFLVINYLLNSGLSFYYVTLLSIALSIAISLISTKSNRNRMHRTRNYSSSRYSRYHRYPRNSKDSEDSWDPSDLSDLFDFGND